MSWSDALSDGLDNMSSSVGNILNYQFGGGAQSQQLQAQTALAGAEIGVTAQNSRFNMILLVVGVVIIFVVMNNGKL